MSSPIRGGGQRRDLVQGRHRWQRRGATWPRRAGIPSARRGPGFPSASPADGVCLLSHDEKGKYLVQSARRQRQTYGRRAASLDAREKAVRALQRLLDVGLPLSGRKIQGNL